MTVTPDAGGRLGPFGGPASGRCGGPAAAASEAADSESESVSRADSDSDGDVDSGTVASPADRQAGTSDDPAATGPTVGPSLSVSQAEARAWHLARLLRTGGPGLPGRAGGRLRTSGSPAGALSLSPTASGRSHGQCSVTAGPGRREHWRASD